MKVIIAEKPSVAREIAGIVGATNKQDGYIEGNNYCVTCALGHLVALAMPQQYGATGFSKEHLPILPETFQLVVRQTKADKGYKDDPSALKQLKVIKSLFDKCESIIVATDAGREGELIFRYIYSYLNCSKPFERLWISSLTEKSIREGLDNLKAGECYDNLYLSAKARSEADWLIGINATQALSVAASEGIYSLGRVQTPTLMMICDRYLENKNFNSVPYWQVRATVEKNGVQFTILSQDRYSERQQADKVSWELMDTGAISVQSVSKKEVREEPPLLYDLTSLQKDMNSKFGFSAEKTLSIAQKLYESKLITYPRTGSRYISEDLLQNIYILASSLWDHPLFGRQAVAVSNSNLNNHSVDAKKVTDHHALLITGDEPNGLSIDEQIIYDNITGRMLEAFSDICVKEITTIFAICGEAQFQTSISVVKSRGWRKVFKEQDPENEIEYTTFPSVVNGEELSVFGGEVLEKKTKPKPIHTEASLLAAMESAGKELENKEERQAMKDCGIGTPATRASIIETLLNRTYIVRDKKALIPTEKGMAVYEVVKSKRIADVQMTGMWEAALASIEQGEMNAETFSDGINVLTTQITRELLQSNIEHTKEDEIICPKCGAKRVVIFDKVAKCQDSVCGFVVFRTISDKQLSIKQIKDLITNRRSEVIKGFKSKLGKNFNATLVLDDSFKVQFEFPEKKR